MENGQSALENQVSENVLVLTNALTSALGTNVNAYLRYGHFAAIVAVIRGDSVSPPKLTGYTPIFNILHPVEIYLTKSGRNEFHLLFLYDVYSGFCKRLHFDKPLFADYRLNRGVASVTLADVVLIILNLYHISLRMQIFAYTLSRLRSVQSAITSCVFVH